MQAHALSAAAIIVLASILLTDDRVHAQAKPAADPEEAAKAQLRPVCADKAARAKVVAQMIANGGEYERATAKWDMDSTCEQLDLPVSPVHDTADPADDASHSDWIYDARWSPDGKLIATAGRDGSVRLWDVATGRTVRKIDITKLPPRTMVDNSHLPRMKVDDWPSHVRFVRFLGDGSLLVVAADTHPVRIFDVASGKPVAEVPYAQPDPNDKLPPTIATTASGLVVLGGYGGELVGYDTKAKAQRYRLPAIANDYPIFAVSETAGLLATAAPGIVDGVPKARDRSVLVQLRKLETGELVWKAEAKGGPSANSMAFSRDGKRLAVAVDGEVHVYATADRKLINKVVVYPTFGSGTVAFTADGQRLVSGHRHAQLWDISTGKRVLHFGPFSDGYHAVDVSPDGKYLVTGHMGSDGRIWDIATGSFHRRLGKDVHPPR